VFPVLGCTVSMQRMCEVRRAQVKPVRIVGLNMGSGCACGRVSKSKDVYAKREHGRTSVLNTYSVHERSRSVTVALRAHREERRTIERDNVVVRKQQVKVLQRLALSDIASISLSRYLFKC
jgi:hypothetical protein